MCDLTWLRDESLLDAEEHRSMNQHRAAILHTPTFGFNSVLLLAYLGLAVLLWQDMPARYPVHFDLTGTPTRWDERGPAMWVLLVAVSALSAFKLHLFQFALLTNPDSTLLNVPHKKLFHQLPTARKIPVLRRANRLIGLVNTLQLLVFSCILVMVWATAHTPGSPIARVANFTLLGVIAIVLVMPFVELRIQSRMIRRKLREEGLLDPD